MAEMSEKLKKVVDALAESWSWEWRTKELSEAEKIEVFWAAAAHPDIEVYYIQRDMKPMLAAATREQAVELLNRIFAEAEPAGWRMEGWFFDAQALIDHVAQHHPDAFDADDVHVPRSATSQVDVALTRAGHRPEVSAATLDKVARGVVSASSNATEWWAFWHDIAPVPRRLKALLKATEDKSIYKWFIVAPATEGATVAQAMTLTQRLSDSTNNRSAALSLLRHHSEEALKAIEAELGTPDYSANGSLLALAGTLICKDLGRDVPDVVRDAFGEHELKTYGSDESELTREALAVYTPAQRDAMLLAAANSSRSWFCVGLGTDPEPIRLALQLAEKRKSDHYEIKYMVQAFGELPAEFALATVIEALDEGKAKGGKAAVGIQVLGKLGHPDAVPTLLAYAGGSSKGNRAFAEQALDAIGDAATPQLVEGLTARKKGHRRAAAARLVAMAAGGSDVSGPVRDAFDAIKDKEVRELLEPLASGELEAVAASPLDEAIEAADAELVSRLVGEVSEKYGPEKVDAFAQHPVEALLALRGVPERNQNAHHRVTERLTESDHALAPWVLVDVVRALPAKTRVWNVKPYEGALRKLGGKTLEPAAWGLRTMPNTPWAHLLLEVIEAHGRDAHLDLFIAALASKSKTTRDKAAEVLSSAPAEQLTGVLEHLTARSKATRIAAATVCRDNPIPHSADALQAALDKERTADVAALLQSALERVAPPASAAPSDPDSAEAEAPDIDLEAELGGARGRLPKFIDLAALPEITSGGEPLSEKARKGLVLRLKQESADFHDAYTVQLTSAIDPDELNRFGRGLLKQWSAAGQKSSHKWAIYQLSVTANSRALAELAGPLGNMVSSGRHAQAGWYLDAFARHRTLEGPSWVHYWLMRADTRGFRNNAQAAFEAAAAQHGVTPEDLVERVDLFIADTVRERGLDDLGLGADATPLSYGDRAFTPRVNRHGAVVLEDGSGALLADLPEVTRDDDAKAAKASAKALTRLRRRVKNFIEAQASHVARQMIVARSWSARELRDGLGAHPVYGPLLAGVVFHGPGGALVTFHGDHGEDVSGERVALADADTLTLAHPASLTDAELDAWRARLSPQPFEQLDRPVLRIQPSGHSLTVQSAPMTASKLAGLIHEHGFRTTTPEDAGIVYGFERRYPERDVVATISHDGYPVSGPGSWPNQVTIEGVYFRRIASRDSVQAAQVPPTILSELAFELKRFGVTIS